MADLQRYRAAFCDLEKGNARYLFICPFQDKGALPVLPEKIPFPEWTV